ncbi:MAG TPA: metalloregulator ArsR/SmtB family transcription factor [Gemmatimonadales bacterium]|nr:metalloregulator ArsR/SmtB family transcription factor [Gemmatimonadales bacterium]
MAGTSFDSGVRLARQCKALGHPARLAIVRYLAAQRGRCTCGDIVDQLPLAQSTVSQHLKVLRNAGLIVGEVEPPRVCYCLNEQALAALKRAVAAL